MKDDSNTGGGDPPLDETKSSVFDPHAASRHERRALFLLLYHGEEMRVEALRVGVPLVVGRSPAVGVAIDDASLSREHARFTRRHDDVVVFQDLDSRNGTWVGGERKPSGELRTGHDVLLGSVTACVHAPGPGGGALFGVDDHERFRARLADEVVRAKFFGRKLAVMTVASAQGAKAHIGRSCARIGELLRPVDRMALYSAETVEILLPEMAREGALNLARTIAALRIEGAGPLRVGVTVYPISARGADELIEQALDAVRRANAERRVECAPARPWGVAKEMPRPREQEAPVIASAVMRELYEDASRLARATMTVLIHGETGAGKEAVAQAVHDLGPRRDRPLVYVNCAAIPEQLVEGTLFGHERGAFTGADQRQKGLFEAADGGTVMLDEIGDLPQAAQAVLLRVLETKRVRRVGATEEVPVDVRILAATHCDLEAMVAQGTFREDLLFRLNAMTLVVPPLRERREEIAPLCERFLEDAIREASDTPVRSIAREALDLLEQYGWPGNVRELRHVIERAVVIARTDQITVLDLPPRIRGTAAVPTAAAPAAAPVAPSLAPPPSDGDYRSKIQHFERQLIIDALRKCGGKQKDAAELLGLPLRTLAHKLSTLKIKRPGYSND